MYALLTVWLALKSCRCRFRPQHTLFFFCACNELFFVALYLTAFYRTPLEFNLLAHLPVHYRRAVPLSISKYLHETLTWPQVLAVITFPVCFGKQVINCVQFWKAAKSLTDLDREEKYIERQAKRR